MVFKLLQDEKWLRIQRFLSSCPGVYVGQADECRRFIEGVIRIARTGAQWRFLPQEYVKWNSIYRRFTRWCNKGVWGLMHCHFSDDPDMESLIIDSTVIRAHPCAAGALMRNGGQQTQAPGRSRGGFSTKIHIAVDALGNPLRFILTGGQRHDITQACALQEGYFYEHLIADKAYDSDDLIGTATDKGADTVIPPRSNREQIRSYDKHLYRERHLVECFINKIKHYRRIFSRFEKMADNYLGFLSFISALIWMN